MIMGTGLGKLFECRDCHEPIRFVKMRETGRALPVDPAPRDDGTVYARISGGRLVGAVISRDHRPGPLDPYRFRPHQASCEARAAKSKPPTAPDPVLF